MSVPRPGHVLRKAVVGLTGSHGCDAVKNGG